MFIKYLIAVDNLKSHTITLTISLWLK